LVQILVFISDDIIGLLEYFVFIMKFLLDNRILFELLFQLGYFGIILIYKCDDSTASV